MTSAIGYTLPVWFIVLLFIAAFFAGLTGKKD